MKPPSRPATSSPDSKEEVEACIVEVNVINRVTVQRLVARVATDEIPPGGYSDGWRGFLSEPASDAPAESVLAGRARLNVAVA